MCSGNAYPGMALDIKGGTVWQLVICLYSKSIRWVLACPSIKLSMKARPEAWLFQGLPLVQFCTPWT